MGSSIDAAIAWGVDLGDEAGADGLEEACRNGIGIGYEFYGNLYGQPGVAVVISDNRLDASWCEAVDPVVLTPPSEEQVAALGRVLDALGFEGDRTPRLLLMASYG